MSDADTPTDAPAAGKPPITPAQTHDQLQQAGQALLGQKPADAPVTSGNGARSAVRVISERSVERDDPSAYGPGWAALAEWQTLFAVSETGRYSTRAKTVPLPKAMGDQAAGWWNPKSDQIVVDANLLPAAPDQIDPSTPEGFQALAEMHGVLVHEIGHAIHTDPGWEEAQKLTPKQRAGVRMLEEIRMEAQTVRRKAENAKWLAASSRRLDVERIADAPDQLVAISAVKQAAVSAALSIEGRVAAGVLDPADAATVAPLIDQALTPEERLRLQRIIAATTQIDDGDVQRLARFGERLMDLFGQMQQQGPGQPGQQGQPGPGGAGGGQPGDEEGSGGDGAGSGGLGKAIKDAMDAALAQAATEAAEELAKSEAGKEIESAQQQAEQGAQAAGPSGDAAGSPSGQRANYGPRPPRPDEQLARRLLAERLRKARWRDRDVTKVGADAPPGRLRTRNAVQNKADRARGAVPKAKPFRKKKRKQVEQPKLRVGLLVDTSGSMGGAIHGVSSALWIIANAVADIGGTTAAAGFGDSVTPLLNGTAPKHVFDFQASGGTAFVHDAYDNVNSCLDLEKPGGGPRLLIVVSDGDWMHDDRFADDITRFRKSGGAVVQIGVGYEPSLHDADKTAVIQDSADVASVGGSACIEALLG